MVGDTPESGSDESTWKRKYYDSLAELESREREAGQMEAVLRDAIARMCVLVGDTDDELEADLSELRRDLRAGAAADAIAVITRRITDHLVRLERKRIARPNLTPAAAQPTELSCNEALLRVLERLEFPDELDADAKTLHERLEQAVAPSEWTGLLTDMADLIAAVRRKAQLEKRELEKFLAELTTRLEEIDRCLGQMDRDRSESLDNGRMLDAAVQEHVRGIHSTVESAAELDQLKQSVEQRLEAIGDHMEQFRRHEETRNAAAEQRIAELNQRLQTLEGEARELRDRVGEERRLALIDRLTGAFNRMAYEEQVEREFLRWQRFGEPLSLAIVDIDDFKRINDSYGHKAGDKVLSTIGQLFRKRIRATDFLARYGGEEFVILMPGADREAALAVVEQLRREVEECGFHHRGDQVAVTISCGVADFTKGDRPDTVFDEADAALYAAKDAGKNRCSVARAGPAARG